MDDAAAGGELELLPPSDRGRYAVSGPSRGDRIGAANPRQVLARRDAGVVRGGRPDGPAADPPASAVRYLRLTDCFTVPELEPNASSPLYVAVIVWLPTASVVVVSVARPFTRDAGPRATLPSMNVTVPVGVPPDP